MLRNKRRYLFPILNGFRVSDCKEFEILEICPEFIRIMAFSVLSHLIEERFSKLVRENYVENILDYMFNEYYVYVMDDNDLTQYNQSKLNEQFESANFKEFIRKFYDAHRQEYLSSIGQNAKGEMNERFASISLVPTDSNTSIQVDVLD